MFENLYRGSCISFPFYFFDLCEVSQCDIIMKNQKFTDLDMDPHMNVIIRGYHRGTLFKMDSRGLSIIQQHYDPDTKTTHWTEIDSWLTDELYLHPKFKTFFR